MGSIAVPEPPLTVGIDGCYVRQWEDKKAHFEVIVGKSMSEDRPSRCFGFVQTYDEKPKRRLFELLKGQGMQMNQRVMFFSDGGADIREVQHYLNPEAEVRCGSPPSWSFPVIYIFTHDSIGVGEDGPTHQPVEHLASLRAIPGFTDIRPCDANEVVEAWRVIMEMKHEPVALILSRQALPTLDRSKYAAASGLRRGAYVLSDAGNGTPDVLLIATGSEVSLCVGAQEELKKQGVEARVISMPSWKLFEDQEETYRESVIPSNIRARVSVEQAARFSWERYVGIDGARIGMRTFGESAPLQKLVTKVRIYGRCHRWRRLRTGEKDKAIARSSLPGVRHSSAICGFAAEFLSPSNKRLCSIPLWYGILAIVKASAARS